MISASIIVQHYCYCFIIPAGYSDFIHYLALNFYPACFRVKLPKFKKKKDSNEFSRSLLQTKLSSFFQKHWSRHYFQAYTAVIDTYFSFLSRLVFYSMCLFPMSAASFLNSVFETRCIAFFVFLFCFCICILDICLVLLLNE